ncbi:hypothetical protein [Pelomonas aquatica]|jgi:hypothetical protein|uniref:Uncharacterized protein n=1 Tax=Pelomonas aquatica TaxID=431058 RepID=A0A9X4R4I0_9BURK|nr:hypothetical protein [Pelomonas aquatica]MCY4753579.1 hypothetical protein [Pelomonas aquatica]MDG0863277.1 hypothetical protein [Pelomonas aquatica]
MAAKSANDSPWLMSPEEVTRQLHTLSDELALTPPQTGAVLQTTTDQLANWRVTGEGPPFVKMGSGPKAQVRYPLGGVRKWRDERTFTNTSMANVSRFQSLGDFLSSGAIQDRYLVAIDEAGGLWDFWESVRRQLDIVEVRWMPMGDILDGFRQQANQRFAEAEADEIGIGLRKPDIAGGGNLP